MNEEEKEAVIGPKILKEIFNESLDQDAELSRNPVICVTSVVLQFNTVNEQGFNPPFL